MIFVRGTKFFFAKESSLFSENFLISGIQSSRLTHTPNNWFESKDWKRWRNGELAKNEWIALLLNDRITRPRSPEKSKQPMSQTINSQSLWTWASCRRVPWRRALLSPSSDWFWCYRTWCTTSCKVPDVFWWRSKRRFWWVLHRYHKLARSRFLEEELELVLETLC